MNKDEVIDLIRDAGFGFLATTEENQPRVRPMMPYLTDEGEILLALLSRSRTIPQIRQNPLVEVCFVDRKMWYCRISGRAVISNDLAKKQVLWDAIPMLKQYFSGPQDESFIFASIAINEVESMTPHQKVPNKTNFK